VRRNRDGIGFLVWLSAALIVVLAVIGFHQRQFTSHVTASVSRSLAGELSLSLAHSVLEEAMHQVRVQVNEPSSPIYLPLRRPVEKPDDGAMSLTKKFDCVHLTESSRLVQQGIFRQFRFKDPTVEVVYQRPFDDLPDERFGLLRYATRVTGAIGSGESAVREVEAFQEFRTVLITPPRPFDELPFYIGRASALTDLAQANLHRRTLLDLYGRARNALKRATDAAPPGTAKSNYENMMEQSKDPASVATSAPEIPEDPNAHVTGIWHSSQSFSLDSMDIARRLQDAIPKAERAVQAQSQALDRALAASGDVGAQERMMAASSEALTLILQEMLRIWGFHLAFQFIPRAAPEYDAYEQKAQLRLGYEHWRKIAFFVLKEDKGGGPEKRIQAQWDRLIKRAANLNVPDPPFNGVVLVENESETLVLRGNLVGKMVVVATRGGLRLENVNPNADNDDSLVAVCLGGALELAGTVNAVVVAAPYRLGEMVMEPSIRMQPETVIRGGLFLPEGALATEWHGLLEYDDKYYGGPTRRGAGWPDHYYVGIAPRTVFRKVARK